MIFAIFKVLNLRFVVKQSLCYQWFIPHWFVGLKAIGPNRVNAELRTRYGNSKRNEPLASVPQYHPQTLRMIASRGPLA